MDMSQFFDCLKSQLVGRYWGLCLLILLLSGMQHGFAQEPEADENPWGPPVTAHGVVMNSATGTPLAHALVTVMADVRRGALTDWKGRFEIANVPSGVLSFAVRKPGFRDPWDKAGNAFHSVRLTKSMPDLVFTLTPEGSMEGRINLSNGDPEEAFSVDILRKSVRHGHLEWRDT